MVKKKKLKYSKKAQKKIEKVLKEFEKKELNIGKSNKKVTSKKQAVAIAINVAKKRGLKVPKKK